MNHLRTKLLKASTTALLSITLIGPISGYAQVNQIQVNPVDQCIGECMWGPGGRPPIPKPGDPPIHYSGGYKACIDDSRPEKFCYGLYKQCVAACPPATPATGAIIGTVIGGAAVTGATTGAVLSPLQQ